MNLAGKSLKLTIITGESDRMNGKPLYETIVIKARELNLAGATVTRGVMSYGGTSRIHTAKVLRLSEELPMVIEIIDSEENILKLIPFLDENFTDGIIYTTPCDVVIYRHHAAKK